MADSNYYNRSRQSIVDIDRELHAIFSTHPASYTNPDGQPVLPAKHLSDVFKTYRQSYGIELLSEDELAMLQQLIESAEGLEATPQTLLGLVAMRSSNSPPATNADADSDFESPHEYSDHEPEPDASLDDWDRDAFQGRRSRSSSVGSSGTAYRPSTSSRPPSRPPSRGPPVPPKTPGPFDSQKRQRSTPLAAPSSWTRPVAPSRRKSDASQHGRAMSDSEQSLGKGRSSHSRSRAPSNPSTPAHSNAISPNGSFAISPPTGRTSRPHSRAQSQPQGHFNNHLSPGERSSPPGRHSPAHLDLSQAMYDSFEGELNSLPMPSLSPHSSDDSDEDESALGLVMDRSAASSTASMEPLERLEALQRANTDLGKKLVESERILQRRMTDHEAELEDMQIRLEETRTELALAKREEKELRGKERQNGQQIAALEAEIAKVQRSLESSRSSYQALQRQYAEQLSQSEELRNNLRRKDQEIKDYRDAAALQAIEAHKWSKEHDAFMERIHTLEDELASAAQTHASLDEQKQENLMLKETIDRMRFDMDELRGSLGSNSGDRTDSRQGSVSRSLGAELLRGMKGKEWEEPEEEDVPASTTLAELGIEEDEDTESEDVIQTIITRKKRRGMSRANKTETSFTIEDTKEYADAYTQYDAAPFQANSSMQTDPEPQSPKIIRASFSTQTDPEPVTPTAAAQTQTDEFPVPRALVSMEIQTDEPEEPEPTAEEEQALASSSSTVQPPTPKAKAAALDDLPPSYTQVAAQPLYHDLASLLDAADLTFAHVSDPTARRELQVAAETLRRLHKGVRVPVSGHTAAGTGAPVSAEAAEEWRALKEELGVECAVIERMLESASARPRKERRRSRFFNIYNTYVYGAGDAGAAGPPSPSWAGGVGTHLLVCLGASVAVFCAMSPFLAHHYTVPGGPTYYDRAAWTSFNSMHVAGEGFAGAGDAGTAVVWDFLGRVGGGAARAVRGWPT
ncbi:hypothetical protein DENSPDRAFT_827117 [Dentipellis sp. KUC8613]|nr:hypothetical protein DENSPDRAFT_827117 [Dentipellis sp. KUC8613]